MDTHDLDGVNPNLTWNIENHVKVSSDNIKNDIFLAILRGKTANITNVLGIDEMIHYCQSPIGETKQSFQIAITDLLNSKEERLNISQILEVTKKSQICTLDFIDELIEIFESHYEREIEIISESQKHCIEGVIEETATNSNCKISEIKNNLKRENFFFTDLPHLPKTNAHVTCIDKSAPAGNGLHNIYPSDFYICDEIIDDSIPEYFVNLLLAKEYLLSLMKTSPNGINLGSACSLNALQENLTSVIQSMAANPEKKNKRLGALLIDDCPKIMIKANSHFDIYQMKIEGRSEEFKNNYQVDCKNKQTTPYSLKRPTKLLEFIQRKIISLQK
jgi:hypothetical protein